MRWKQQAEKFEKNVGLLIGKGLFPMYIVEVPFFPKMVLHCDQQLTLLSRKKVTKLILPDLDKYSLDIGQKALKRHLLYAFRSTYGCQMRSRHLLLHVRLYLAVV